MFKRFKLRDKTSTDDSQTKTLNRQWQLRGYQSPELWDEWRLREFFLETLKNLLTARDRGQLTLLRSAVAADILQRHSEQWPAWSISKDVRLSFTNPGQLIDLGDDQVLLRYDGQLSTAWYDGQGRQLKAENEISFSYKVTWSLVDETYWQLTQFDLSV
jgi:hypothetical protein